MDVLLEGEVTALVGEPLKVGETLPHFKLEDLGRSLKLNGS